MYSVGDIVLHASSGVCLIDDIREERFSGKPRMYYVMHPLCEDSKMVIYVPLDSEKSPLRGLHSRENIRQMIRESANEVILWSDNNNLRKNQFTEILRSDNISRIIALIECLSSHRKQIEAAGKKFPLIDERILIDCEKKISQEFSYALEIDSDEVPGYIRRVAAERVQEPV